MTATDCKKTPLYDFHLAQGAKMVPFAGYEMPVQYPMGVKAEHLHTREQAGLFDISHMGPVHISGAAAAEALERILPTDVIGLAEGQQVYTVLTNEQGGIRDDLIISNMGGYYRLVVNAACKDADLAYIQEAIGKDVEISTCFDDALIAVQGPSAREVVAAVFPAAANMLFMQTAFDEFDGVEAIVSCSGYTGEDGFEIAVPADKITALCERLLADERLKPIGLGARDSLRLEAGLCLYGHDLDTETTPAEAVLMWSVPKVRREGGERAGGFPGADAITQQIAQGVARKRVGLRVQGKAPVREGAELIDADGNAIGNVCSGSFGPSIAAPIAMGYVATEHAQLGASVFTELRGRRIELQVEKMPFVPARYFRG
jgi:aminomethyltransferase